MRPFLLETSRECEERFAEALYECLQSYFLTVSFEFSLKAKKNICDDWWDPLKVSTYVYSFS